MDLRARQRRRGGRLVKLERIPAEILALLVERHGETVTRGQIVERIWGAGTFLDTDNGINGAVRKLRQALRDHPERPRFVQTVTGSGYRFIGGIELADAGAAAPSVAAREAVTPEGPPAAAVSPPSTGVLPVERARWRWPVLAAFLTVLLVTAQAAYLGWSSSRVSSATRRDRPVLAVLPFENLTGDAAQEYLSDGLTEEMIAQIGRLAPERLSVIARTSVMAYKHTTKTVDRIGRELTADYVLEGSVRRDAQHVRVTAELVQAKRQTRVWSREYDRELGSLLSLQTEIADEVTTEISQTLGTPPGRGAKASASSTTPAAFEPRDP